MKEKNSSSGLVWAIVGLAAGGALGWWISRPRSLPDLYSTQRNLAKLHGEVRAGFLTGKMQEKYNQLMAQRPRFSHPALRMHLEGNILPGLAIYQVLRDELGDPAAAQAETEQILAANFIPRRKPLWQMLGLLPQPFRLMRPAMRWIMRFGFPAEGWETEWVEDNEQRIGMDISRCFYLDVLTALGAPELTRTFCALDDHDAQLMPPGIVFERSATLGRGQTCCDFRYGTPAGRSSESRVE